MKKIIWVIGLFFFVLIGYSFYIKTDFYLKNESRGTAQTQHITFFNPADLNFTEDFEAANSDWVFTEGDSDNKWVVGTAAFNGDGSTKGLYISNDEGTTNAYTIGNASATIHAIKQLPAALPADIQDVEISFDWRCAGEGATWDYFKVWIVPATFTPTEGTLIEDTEGVQVGGVHNLNPDWITANYVVNLSTYAGENVKIIFEWRNDGSGGTQPPAAIDNLKIKGITCSAPTALNVTDITPDAAQINWTAPTGVTNFDYYYSTANTTPADTQAPSGTSTATTALLSDLTPNTQYYVWVRSNCGTADGNSFWVPVNFMTACVALDVPFFEGFNSNSTTEACWTVIDANNDGDAWDMNYTSTPFEGDEVATLNTDYNDGDNDDWLISPTLNLSATPGAKRLKFHYKVQSAGEPNDFVVKLSTSGSSPADFTEVLVPLASYSNTNYVETIVNLQNAAGVPYTGNINIAFHVPPGGLDGWRLYIDNVIIEDVPPCVEPTNLKICAGSVDATVSWEAGGTETSWEYVLSPGGSGMPVGNGTVVAEPNVFLEDLTVNQTYDVWIRAVCPGEAGYSSWIKKSFITSSSNLKDANPFCAGPEGIVFPNVHDGMEVPNTVPGESFHCLGSTPNPVWYYLKIQNPGDLDFEIIQNTAFDAAGNPTGTGLDVDFVAFGPFNSIDEFCEGITIAPGSPAGNPEIDCSYSAAPIENFTITNAQTGQIYALLITNFNGDPGFIKLVQTNAGGNGAGSTDCSFLCEVDLGEDITVCAGTEVTLTAETSSAGGGSDINTIEWYKDEVLMDPAVYNTTTITVTESGTYKVKVSKDNCTEEFVYDEVVVTFLQPYAGNIPDKIALCDELNDGEESFDLGGFINQLNIPSAYNAAFYATEETAEAGDVSAALPSPFVSGNTTVYLRIESSVLNECYRLVPVQLILIPVVDAVVVFSYNSPVCYDSLDVIAPELASGFTSGGTFSSTNGLMLDPITGEINVKDSQPGEYTVKYEYIVPEGSCGEDKSYETKVRITEPIKIDFYIYCNKNQLFIEAFSTNPMLPVTELTFEWSGVDTSSSNQAVVSKEGTYSVTVTDKEGCPKTFEYVVDNPSCLIQKGISPNGDGLNDSFNLSNYDIVNLQLFNRYGKEVYTHGPGYTNQWTGQDKGGNLLPDGTYFYKITTPSEELTGYIQVVREMK